MKASLLIVPLIVFASFVSACGGSGGETTNPTTSTCSDVYILSARSSFDQSGEGILAPLVDQIIATSHQKITRASLTYSTVDSTPTEIASSMALGVSKLKTVIQAEVQNCPNEKLVLLGYSMGAGVVLDALGGGGGGGFTPATPPLDAALASHVAAVVAFADLRHVGGQLFDAGTATHMGVFPRSAEPLRVLNTLASRVRSYCDDGDPYCDSGPISSLHLTYLLRYQTDATQYVIRLIGS